MTKKLNRHFSRPAPGRASATVARDLLRLVGAYGGNQPALLREAGLTHLSASLLSPTAPAPALSHEEFTRLHAHCTWALDECAARQEGREPLTKLGVDMLCHCVITSRTLREAIERTDQFSLLIGRRAGRLRLHEEGGVARLDMETVRTVRNACAYLSDLTGLSTYHRLFGWLIGEDIALTDAAMRYPPLLDERTTFYLMPHPLTHGAAENSLRFAAGYLDRPVIRTPQELEPLIRSFPFDLAVPLSKDAPLSERILHLFAAMLASGEAPATAAWLARSFSISEATLKRRLAAESTSLIALRTQARRDLAARLLSDPRLSVSEIARRTHFSDATAFRRAFHQWTGQSPAAWRAELR
ncbi:helix-turn-helix transcriptional regulator [Sphingobium estronivorans]|uniref:helix-turn-helix transcriptional regulator n=1 Tax=Sphingobium estronivorans TaxID=1577690 RepID=UPI00123A090D|nr:AraC family transcriptional regulator [Sphingobium estronivorans]